MSKPHVTYIVSETFSSKREAEGLRAAIDARLPGRHCIDRLSRGQWQVTATVLDRHLSVVTPLLGAYELRAIRTKQ